MRRILVLLFFSFHAQAQTANQQMRNDSTLVVVRNGVEFEFKVSEAVSFGKQLYERINPERLENAHYPPALKQTLLWVQNNAGVVITPVLPPEFDQKDKITSLGLTMAGANYCSVPERKIFDYPCVYIYASMLKAMMRFEYPLLRQPNREFLNTVALYIGHEAIHLEKGLAFFTRLLTNSERKTEETRTWLRTTNDFVRPLRLAGEPMSSIFRSMDDLLKPCGYKLPCKAFEAAVPYLKNEERR